jgi:hypothetical protein
MQKEIITITLEGNLEEIAFYEILHFFELNRKRGFLYLISPDGEGTISFENGTIMDAAWDSLQGEDAIIEMFNIRKGTFSFEPKEVPPGNIMKPISVVLMGAAVLFDELPAIEEYIPEQDSQLILSSTPFNTDNIDVELITQSIKEGHATLAELYHNLNISGTKIRVSVAKLIKQGLITGVKQNNAECHLPAKSDLCETKPFKILVAFTDEGTLTSCLSFLGINGDTSRKKRGFSDFCSLTLASRTYNIFLLKGETKLSFLWEPILKTTDGAIFIFNKDESEEHAAFFYRVAKTFGIPFLGVSFNRNVLSSGVRLVHSSEEMEAAILSLTEHRFIDNYL